VELAPPVLYEHGLAAALEWLAAETRKNYNVAVTVEADSLANPKVADVRIFLFRAVRELLLNSVKHAVGSAVRITMQHLRPDKVRIVVADGGPGFDPTSLDDKRTGSQTFGLLDIRERVSGFGGEFHISSGPQARDPNNTLAASRLHGAGQVSRWVKVTRDEQPMRSFSAVSAATLPHKIWQRVKDGILIFATTLPLHQCYVS
jgi:signal transduction histidine kinase